MAETKKEVVMVEDVEVSFVSGNPMHITLREGDTLTHLSNRTQVVLTNGLRLLIPHSHVLAFIQTTRVENPNEGTPTLPQGVVDTVLGLKTKKDG